MEEIQNNSDPVNNIPKKRPQILGVICILTFIWSGYGILYNLMYAIFYNTFKEIFTTMEFPAPYKELKPALLQVLSAGRWFFVAGFLLSFFSIFGAVKMWNLQKKGFHLYTISQILLLMLPLIFIKTGGLQSVDFLITAMFVAMYATHLKIMA